MYGVTSGRPSAAVTRDGFEADDAALAAPDEDDDGTSMLLPVDAVLLSSGDIRDMEAVGEAKPIAVLASPRTAVTACAAVAASTAVPAATAAASDDDDDIFVAAEESNTKNCTDGGFLRNPLQATHTIGLLVTVCVDGVEMADGA